MKRRHGIHVILGAITPAHDSYDSETLAYPYLRSSLKSRNLQSFIMQNTKAIWRSPTSFRHSNFQEDWRITYLLSTAYRLQKARLIPEKVFWSTQFTTTSVKLFGRPLSREVAGIAEQEIEYYAETARLFDIDESFTGIVIGAYSSLLTPRSKTMIPLEKRYQELLVSMKHLLHSKYSKCFAIFDSYSSGSVLQPEEIASVFRSALRVLKTSDSTWNDWDVVMDDSAKMSVNVMKSKIVVGHRRAPLKVSEARGLFVHEVLVHAKRAINGANKCHDLMIGLPDYLTAEEGFGVLLESAISGSVPRKVKDRYVDIALAIGSWNRRPYTRNELYMFCYTRAVLRSIADNEPINLDDLEKVTWEHVNRIYRGSLGNNYVGVFTKDVAYYKGFIKMANYFQRALKRDRLEESMEFVYQGKFDPTNKSHRDFVRQVNN